MKFRQNPSILISFTAIFLMLTLAFLTVSLPFVYSARQMVDVNSALNSSFPIEENDCESDNPFAGTTEEKTSTNLVSVSEEYLHETHSAEEYLAALCKEYKIEHVATYIAFYGDLICPPPDFA
jgi:hypothetical protein